MVVLAALAFLSCWANAAPPAIKRPNVLFIMVDDLRPALGCYGDAVAKTPNIDRLASRGTRFEHAYCQQAVCSPSRLSLLTGRRPDSIRVWDLKTHFRDAMPDVVTLPQAFKSVGYQTQSIGKIFHGGGPPSKDGPSWTIPPQFDLVRDPKLRYATEENLAGKGLKRSATEVAEVADDYYVDGKVCNAAINELRERSKRGRFFLAVGFRKPHLPFCAPKKYWDLYDRASIPAPATSEHPKDAPELATRSWNELEGYTDIPASGKLSVAKIQELRHGYYACVSYIDALVGRLLDELDSLLLTDRTVVVLLGDHGFHLGEQGLWTKANNYELAARVPLIISTPKQSMAIAARGLVELIDVYPTLIDECKIPAIGCEGKSLRPMLYHPHQAGKPAAYTQYPRSEKGNRHRSHGDIMGYAMRTKRYRYVEWQDWTTKNVIAQELYDHDVDPNESINIAKARTDVTRELSRRMRSVAKESAATGR